MGKKCKINEWGCIYHACMSDDCQKEIMIEQGGDLGPAECENKFPHIPVAKPDDCIIEEIPAAPPSDGKIKLY